jgi:hypothetical protein
MPPPEHTRITRTQPNFYQNEPNRADQNAHHPKSTKTYAPEQTRTSQKNLETTETIRPEPTNLLDPTEPTRIHHNIP